MEDRYRKHLKMPILSDRKSSSSRLGRSATCNSHDFLFLINERWTTLISACLRKESKLFKNLLSELNIISKITTISVPIASDSEGYFDKECPSSDCLFQFKVHTEDWSKIVREEEVFCPSCRHSAPSRSWYTREQIEAGKKHAIGQVTNAINGAMRADAIESKLNSNRNSFLSITLEVKGGKNIVLLPIAAVNPMRLRTTCENCSCRYAFIGAAYFCPSCGENSAKETFIQTIRTIRIASNLENSLIAALDPDQAEVITRSLLEKGMQDTVTSFQRLSERLYQKSTGKTAPKNAFQRLESGSKLWEQAIGKSYSQIVGNENILALQIFFQQRHLLSHQQGIVDQEYVDRSGDKSYLVAQRLCVRSQAVQEFADIIERLGSELLDMTK